MTKLLYYRILKFEPEALKLLRERFEIKEIDDPRGDTDDVISDIEVAFAPLGFFFGSDKIDRMPKLKVIASNTTGDPHIDVAYAKKKGVKVITLKYEQEFLGTITPTAEHAWGLLLALSRNIVPANRAVLRGEWDRKPFGGKAMLSRMTLGIVGLGRLGSMVAEYAKAFRMKDIRYYDPYVTKDDPSLKKVSSLADLVKDSDIVTVHVPANEETANLINENVFSNFKTGAYLINTARAEIVDSNALLSCLQSGRLGGAALDVFPGEFEPDFLNHFENHPLVAYARSHDNVLITPHIGGSTIDAWQETQLYTIHKVIEHIYGK